MRSVAIVGVGLIGGSFARALRQAGFAGEIVGVSSPATIAKATGVVDRGVTLEEAASCDLVFLAQPIFGIIETLGRLQTTALVTDAGSTKRAICQAAAHLPNFLGGHPMAGKEVSGVENSDAELFRGRPWILTSTPPPEFREWLERIGARVMILGAEEHDHLVALSSHVPQLISNAIAKVSAPARAVAGPGLESMTRLSRSSFSLWRDIIATNRDEIGMALDDYIAAIQAQRDALRRGDDELLFGHRDP